MVRGFSVHTIVFLCVCLAACSKSSEKPATTGEPVPEALASPATVTYELTEDQRALIFDTPIQTLEGQPTTLGAQHGKGLLLVNVASQCGLTPQYEQLQALQGRYEGRGFSVIGFPSNQFGEQEPGTPDEILAFSKDEYKVTFPLMEKIDTNGPNRHPVYQALTQIKDAKDEAGDIKWNFEKFLISADHQRITRFRSEVVPDDPLMIDVLEAGL